MKQKLIFLDIDGTLLPPGDMLIPESTLAALDSAKANGSPSGRPGPTATGCFCAPAAICA